MSSKRSFVLIATILGLSAVAFLACPKPDPNTVEDEAKKAGKTREDFPQSTDDYYKAMDGGIQLTPDEVAGRNTWMVWTGGNEGFWDHMANHSFGALDLIKVLDSRNRDKRFKYYGLINDPGMKKASQPDEHGLWLDEPAGPPEPFDEAIYGKPSGVVGLRLYPNPNFKGAALAKWNPEDYYSKPNYYFDRNLVRPYRVGMACSFCHVGPHPLNPPADVENPKWENLSTNVGAQYFWTGRIFANSLKPDNFVWQLFNTSPPGTIDTSAIATDNINNPRTMNAIYEVGARLKASELYPKEKMAGGALALGQVQEYKDEDYTFHVPHVLKDGSDSVGIYGALNRVYINIGTFYEDWLLHFRPLVGGKKQSPISVEVAQKNSVYWQATEDRAVNLAKFFIRAAGAHHLEDAPGGAAYLTQDQAVLNRGKIVFAETCAGCHSSKQPPANIAHGTPEYLDWMRQEVVKPDFRANNYLSTEARYPVTINNLQTNACSPLATNAIRNNVWDNFSSETYKTLPAVGQIQVQNPLDGTPRTFDMPGGGRGYQRAPSLVSMWSTAPYLHNNNLGKFNSDPSVAGRIETFNDGVEKLLWPEKRANDDCQEVWGLPFCGPIYRTTEESWIIIHRSFLPDYLRPLFEGDELKIGPIPKGTPVNLLANINLEGDTGDLLKVLVKTKRALRRIKSENMNQEQSTALLKTLVPDLLKVSKCPDFAVDRGHTFGSQLADNDKRALIEFLKTL